MKLLRLVIVFVVFTLIMLSPAAGEQSFTIIHSNDLHSHLLGFSPNIDYTPSQTGDDITIGGCARIATVINEIKKDRKNPVLVLDAGDFLIGSLFHILCHEHFFELKLMKLMGYDVITLGNHEFDLMPEGLARMLTSAHNKGYIPCVVLSNAVFSKQSDIDDSLEKVFEDGIVKPYVVMEKDGVKFGFFGLIGKHAAEVARFAFPVSFEDPVYTAKKIVKNLREKEKVDIVVCLSHSGLRGDKGHSEDEILAKEVDGIDIIISGHSHTKTDGVIQINNTIIVQAWEYGKQLGVIDVTYDGDKLNLKNYRLVDIDDSIKGDEKITCLIESFETIINQKALAKHGLKFRKIIGHTDFDLRIETDESNLGNLIADAVRWYINKNACDFSDSDKDNKITFSVVSNGVIRDDIIKGKSGKIAVCDAFRTIPLGSGFDGTMGYPLVSFYLYPSEIKKGLEILTSIYPIKGENYFLQISGVRFTYNPNRMMFDRVTQIQIGSEENGYIPLDYSGANKRLYRVAADIYNASFLKMVGDFTWNILDIIPKDRDSNPIVDLKTVRIDADNNMPGIQELKEWKAVIEYIQNFPDITGDGISDIPDKYKGKLGRIEVKANWNPYKLLKNGTYITWITFFILTALFCMALITMHFIWKKIRK